MAFNQPALRLSAWKNELSRRLDSDVHLIMGPWTHSGDTRSYAGDVEFGSDAAIQDFHHEFHLRWFDRVLKGKRGDAMAPVQAFVMGTGDGHKDGNGKLYHGGEWREASEWPLPGTEFVPFYFQEDGTLSADKPGGKSSATTYRSDPDNPVPTIGGSFSSTSPVFEPGAYDQRTSADVFGAEPPYLPLKSRSDVVVFQTAPLEQDVVVVGPVVVKLHVSSSAPDTDFTAKLVDVYPPSADFPTGFEMNITDGIVRARYRERPDQPVLMEEGGTYEIEITPFPTANVFKKGHRIRVDIASSNFPRFDINPNTGEALGRHRNKQTAENTIMHSADRPSHIVLPIIPAN